MKINLFLFQYTKQPKYEL